MFIAFILSCQMLSGQAFNQDDLDNKLLKNIEGNETNSSPFTKKTPI
jgi:hypothetical protein